MKPENPNKGKKYRSLSFVGFYLVIPLWLTGIAFKIMHWPGANEILIAFAVLTTLIALPAFVFLQFLAKKAEHQKVNWFLLIGLAGLGEWYVIQFITRAMHWLKPEDSLFFALSIWFWAQIAILAVGLGIWKRFIQKQDSEAKADNFN